MATAEGYDEAVWEQMASQLGLQGLAVAEEYGGAGFGFVELLVVFEEFGRALYCGPYFSTVALSAGLLGLSSDTAAKERYLPKIASGQLIATVAFIEDAGTWDEPGTVTRATNNGNNEWTLRGVKSYVVDGGLAKLIIVPARSDEGVSLFVVDAPSPGLTRESLDTMDATRKQSRLTFDETPARLLDTLGQGWPVLVRALSQATIALAGEQVGGSLKVLEIAVEYAKTREQFGRAIGSFQAIKHKCANLYVESESAGVVARYAAWTVDAKLAEVPMAASVAKAYCSEAFVHAAAENIQIHGGVGFTWDNDAHLYLRRAKTSEMYLGDAMYHRELIAQDLQI